MAVYIDREQLIAILEMQETNADGYYNQDVVKDIVNSMETIEIEK